jgi:hypothetical protein
MNSVNKPKSCTPNSDLGGTAGYASSFSENTKELAQTADKYLQDFLLLNKLTERVYELLLEDMRIQRERVNNYGNHRW